MVNVSLTYHLKNKSFLDEFSFPSNWNELTKKQFLFIASIWQSLQHLTVCGEDLLEARVRMFLALTGKQSLKTARRRIEYIFALEGEKQLQLVELTDFIFSTLDIKNNKLPVLKYWFKRFAGPTASLGNISIGSFNVAITSFNAYNNTKEEKHLNQLVAALYTRKNIFGKVAEFNMKAVDKNCQTISKISHAEKMGVWLFFYACLDNLSLRYKTVFEKKSEGGKSKFGFTSVILALSGNKFGPFKETEKTNVHLVMMELENMADKKTK